tara:strand:+ start:275 stop:484 length:210 start_codon:yes stop_codon:yes gene_type:complete
MFGKFEILFIVILILTLFYFVISLGARKKNKADDGKIEIKKYLRGVRVLIILIAIISFILWIIAYNIFS